MRSDKFTRVYAVLLSKDELEEVRSHLVPHKEVWGHQNDPHHPGLTSLHKIDEALERVEKPQLREKR